MINQLGFGKYSWRHQTIAWAYVNPDLCRHITALGHNEFDHGSLFRQVIYSHSINHDKEVFSFCFIYTPLMCDTYWLGHKVPLEVI